MIGLFTYWIQHYLNFSSPQITCLSNLISSPTFSEVTTTAPLSFKSYNILPLYFKSNRHFHILPQNLSLPFHSSPNVKICCPFPFISFNLPSTSYHCRKQKEMNCWNGVHISTLYYFVHLHPRVVWQICLISVSKWSQSLGESFLCDIPWVFREK